MKILVLSDSHSALRPMRQAIDKLKPDHVIHLGDLYDDGQSIADMYPHLRVHQVPGNCDYRRAGQWWPDFLCYDVGGVRLYMTHGHLEGVKSDTQRLIALARQNKAQAVLYGHTHRAECYQIDGLLVMNPGTCQSYEGTVGVLEIDGEKISASGIFSLAELMEL